MTGTNAELIAWGKMLGGREQELAEALEAAEAERDAALGLVDRMAGSQSFFSLLSKAEAERDAALDVIAEVRELAGAGVTNMDGCWMDAEACERILAKAAK